MIVSSDDDYRATKLVKQGHARLQPPFDELASWIHRAWGVRPLNVIYDSRNKLHPPRLQVVFEFQNEAARFRSGFNFDRQKQEAICARFGELAGAEPHRFDLTNLFVIFSAFAPVAMGEANGRVPEEEISALQQRLADPALWCIYREFASVTFMFYTDRQLTQRTTDGSKQSYCQAFFDVLKPYDEFGYVNLGDFIVRFDSKETFDRVYRGSWFFYSRR